MFSVFGVSATRAATGDRSTGIRAAVSMFPVRRRVEARRVVLAAAGVAFAAIFALQHLSPEAGDGAGLLYVVPIALAALELGLTAGIASAALALGLIAVWSLNSHADLDAIGFTMRGLAFVAVGAAAGRFGDRMRDAHARHQLLLDSGLTLAHLDVADDLPYTLAEQTRKLCSAAGARVELNGSPAAEAGALDEDGLERVPIELRGTRHGTLTVSTRRPVTPEDRATLRVLAMQAAVAAESRRLLDSERERAVIHTELHDARRLLAERGGQLRELLERQEAERHHVAYELREQAAQTLAATLLALGALERELGAGLATPTLGALRSDVGDTLRSLRSLAASLRPPLEVGLHAALEDLADDARGHRLDEIRIALPDQLTEEVATLVYRVAEEAMEAVGPAQVASVRTQADGAELAIEVKGAQRPIPHERLAVLRARIELVDGTISAGDSELSIVIPLPPEGRPNADLAIDGATA